MVLVHRISIDYNTQEKIIQYYSNIIQIVIVIKDHFFKKISVLDLKSEPILFPSGTVNIIVRQKKNRTDYIRINKNGQYF